MKKSTRNFNSTRRFILLAVIIPAFAVVTRGQTDGAVASGPATIPHGSSPTGTTTSATIPPATIPHGSSPAGTTTSATIPPATIPHGSSPTGTTTSATIPPATIPSATIPSATIPHGSSPSGTTTSGTIPPERMQQVYEEVKTPYKYGIVIRGEEGQLVDCPSIFRQKNRWYMVYVAISNKIGYETYLARSTDLLHWEKLGKIMSFRSGGWDKWQVDGGIALCDTKWGGSYKLHSYDGKYWMSYIGGALQGYEPDPLAIGMAWTKNPAEAREWTPIPGNPVLSIDQQDVREFEKMTLYKSQIILDKAKTLGFPFVMYYNGKMKNGFEKIGMAVSDDMVHWKRFGTEPVVANGEEKQNGISGDPQIVRMGDLWVMFYFGAFWQPGAFDTFACSYDMVHWTKWEGSHLIASSEPWDKTYAHKPWIIKHKGVVYHFYCAVGDQGRVIALATSKDLKTKK